jgi:glutamyl-tRNA reductase
MFTRGPKDLNNTAIFIGGSDVAAGERLLEEVVSSFFEHIRVSVMIDSNGSNTTAAAAVVAAAGHLNLAGITALVLAATGPVGVRVTQLLAAQGSTVRVASRSHARAEAACSRIQSRIADANLTALAVDSSDSLTAAIEGVDLVVCAGAAGVQLLSANARRAASALRVAIDLNAVPPLGIQGIQVHDQAAEYDGVACYGAVGVGDIKMKIHKTAIRQLYTRNDQILDAEAIYELGTSLVRKRQRENGQ